MRVVIVGGAGFIGSELARSLRGLGMVPEVIDTAPRLIAARVALQGVASAAFDFTVDRDVRPMLEGADAMVHLACTTNPAHSMQRLAWDAESNIAPSIRLFDAAVAAGVRRVIFASSGGTVYGAPARLPVLESDPTRPLSGYGVSKLAIEHYLSLYPQLNGISLRIANPYGAYQLAGATVGVIARFITTVRSNQPIGVWGDGSVVRDYIAIEDVVAAFVAALTVHDLSAGPYNVGAGRGTSVREIIAAVFDAAVRTVPVNYLEGRPYDVPAIFLDTQRFRDRTGWEAKIPLAQGIADLWASGVEERAAVAAEPVRD